MRTNRGRSTGLVLEFSLLMVVLVILIVAGVAVPLALQMRGREQQTLAKGLQKRAEILLESVALRAAEPIRAGISGYSTVSTFPAEVGAMPGEALAMTISGPADRERPGAPAAEDPLDRDYLWASNDPLLTTVPFETAARQVADPRLDRERVRELARNVNAAAAETGKAPQEVAADTQSRHTGSEPEFDPKDLKAEYLFYRPLVAPDPDGYFFSGLVRLTVSTNVLSQQVARAMNTMVRTAGWVALIVVAVGILGAFLLASIVIRPIRRLVTAVSAIRDAEDKSRLKEITVGARDEIGTLAETVNEMTVGLVSAAIAEREMMIGRDYQKKFLPLEQGEGGQKGSTGGVKTAEIDLYAFYEGATKVSGDYFDWQKLDDQYYVVMKCDVSGHGVEAAFIMVEVATLFLRWCREWTVRLPSIRDTKERDRARRDLLKLDKLIYTINDMIEERGFGGKFAAFMLCLYDVRNGLVTACSAGDNVLYHFDVASKSMVTREIKPEHPAVGQISSDIISSLPARYTPVQLQLNSGDVLVLFTDGFEESKRHFRDGAGMLAACTEPQHRKDNKQDAFMATHTVGEDVEEMSVPRILGIFNAFFNRKMYRLERHHVAQPEDLEFDFSGSAASLEEAVLALVSVERVYRTYRDPKTSLKDGITMEVKVDQYLRKHFRQYEKYFEPQDSEGKPTEYIRISNVKEDIQVDDLTVVLLRRP